MEEQARRGFRGGVLLRSLLAVVAVASLLPALAHAKPQAPGAPGEAHTWAPADKHGFGTAHDLQSQVWFTLRAAELTEVYYPDLGTPSLRDLEFAVTDGSSFIDRETDAGVETRVVPVPGSLAFQQVTSTERWRLEKTWIADPKRDTVLADVRFASLTGEPLRLYLLADPAPGDDGNDDRGHSLGSRLLAVDDTVASQIAAEPGLRSTTSGYRGSASDPWSDLSGDYDLDDEFDARRPGNVVQAALTQLTGLGDSRNMTLAIGFGANGPEARASALGALEPAFLSTARRYASGWHSYVDSLSDPPASVAGDAGLRSLYHQSLMVLEASEDKTYRGASVASPSMPWVWGTLTLEATEDSGPYHLVWPRDLYHVATAQKAAGDDEAPIRALEYLWRVQKPDGSWWQNTEVDGRKRWENTQLDEVALPVVLAWWLDRTGPTDWTHVRKAANYIVCQRAREPAGALGEPGRLVAKHDRHRDRRVDLRGRHRAPERRVRTGDDLRARRRPLAAPRGGLDRDGPKPVLRAHAPLPPGDEGRQPQRRQYL